MKMIKSQSQFRSITDLKGYDDAEKNDLPSLTDRSSYEPLQSSIKRMLRGETVQSNGLDFSTEISVSEQPGADLSDIHLDIIGQVLAKDARSESEAKATEVKAATTESSAPPANVDTKAVTDAGTA